MGHIVGGNGRHHHRWVLWHIPGAHPTIVTGVYWLAGGPTSNWMSAALTNCYITGFFATKVTLGCIGDAQCATWQQL